MNTEPIGDEVIEIKANQEQVMVQRPQQNFRDLLKLLGEVHEQELAAALSDNASLRCKMKSPLVGASDAKSVVTSIQMPEPPKPGAMSLATMNLQPRNLSRKPSDSSNSSAKSEKTECWCNNASDKPFRISNIRDELVPNSRPSRANGSSGTWAVRVKPRDGDHSDIKARQISTRDLGRSDLRRYTNRLGHRVTVTGKVFSKSFELWARWAQEAEDQQRKVSFARRSRTYAELLERSEQTVEIETGGNDCLQSVVLHPSSFKRLAWDLLCIILLAYDIISVPFVGAFNPDPSTFLVFMTWATAIFWNVDIVMSLLTGYQHGKQIILAPKKIFRRFAKSWMVLDLTIVSFDWVLIGMGEQDSGSAARLGRSLRTLRFVRTLRLLRVLKLKRIVQEIQDNINTETLSIWFGIFKIIVCLVVANHIVACGWYTVGSLDDSRGWVDAYSMEARTISYRYTTSLHWSLTQFTPASMEVVPHNVGERIFAVLILLIAMIAFSSFVSILTALMGELRSIHNDETRQFWLLRRYLRDWSVSRSVGKRIQHYLEYAYTRQRQKVQEKDVGLLGLLSEALRDELKYEVQAPALQCHPFFYHCTDEWMRFISRAIENVAHAQGDVVFACGDVGYSLHFVTHGCLEYARGVCEKTASELTTGEEEDDHVDMDRLMSDCTTSREFLNEGSWISEAVLWCPWAHLGDLQAVIESTLINIDRDKFGEAVQGNTNLNLTIRRYARAFLRELNRLESQDLTDLAHTCFSPLLLLEERDFPRGSTKRCSQESDLVESSISTLKRRTKRRLREIARYWLGARCMPIDVEPEDEVASTVDSTRIRVSHTSELSAHPITPGHESQEKK